MESILREIVGETVNSIISLIEDRNLLFPKANASRKISSLASAVG